MGHLSGHFWDNGGTKMGHGADVIPQKREKEGVFMPVLAVSMPEKP